MAEDTGFKPSIQSEMIDSFNSFGIVLDFLRVVDLALMADAGPNEIALATVLDSASVAAERGQAATQRALDALGMRGGQAHG